MNDKNERPGQPNAAPRSAPWYQTAFGDGYLELYRHRDLAEAERAIETIAARLELNPGHRLLDLCCGPGRHMVFLARKVRRVVGLDLSSVLLAQARLHWADFFQTGQAAHPFAMLVRGTMRQLPFAGASFDRVVNLFTSFGYFEDPGHNQAVMDEVARLLRPGGRFVIDHINRPALLATLQAQSERTLENGQRLLERRRWDHRSERVIKDVLCLDPDGRQRQWYESVRVYTLDQIEAMLTRAGMEPVDRLGSYNGEALADESSRMIVFARKR